MKKTYIKSLSFSMLLLVVLAVFARGQDNFTVRIKLTNIPPGLTLKLRLFYDDGKSVIDTSSKQENGWIVFKGQVTHPVNALLGVLGDTTLGIKFPKGTYPPPFLRFFLSNEQITIEGNERQLCRSMVTGGIMNKETALVHDSLVDIEIKNWEFTTSSILQYQQTKNKLLLTKADSVIAANTALVEKIMLRYIVAHPDKLSAMFYLAGMKTQLKLDQLINLYESMSDIAKESFYGKEVKEKIRTQTATAIGQQAIPIWKMDIEGREINLNTLKGKYILLDFWGSWCKPCRMSHPHLKEIYAKYKNKGLEIIGIAHELGTTLEQSKTSWEKAIKDDGLNWIQVLNMQGIETFDAVKAYDITSFPTKILLDRDGIIIGRFVGNTPVEIDAKLRELFGDTSDDK